MLKLIFTLLFLFTAGFFMAREQWNVSLTGFGYEITFSVVFLFFIILIITYLMYLAAKPFGWINRYKNYTRHAESQRREQLLSDILCTVLDKNENKVKSLLKRANNLFQPKSLQYLLIQACFQPNTAIFEELYKNESTKLAGLRGLINIYIQDTDENQALKLIEKNPELLTSIGWMQKMYFDLLVRQNEWKKAENTLEILRKNNLVSKKESIRLKALILFNQGRLNEAYSLTPAHPIIAVSYARQNPQKAQDILSESFKKFPCFETYEAYNELIKSEDPVRRVKLIEKLTARLKGNKVALIALAQTAYEAHLYGLAKEQMDIYLRSFPLTKQVAFLMAKIEREGWHHNDAALSWEEKGLQAEEKSSWFCTSCGHETPSYSTSCPICQTFGGLMYRS